MQIVLQIDPKNASEVAHGIRVLKALNTDEVVVGSIEAPLPRLQPVTFDSAPGSLAHASPLTPQVAQSNPAASVFSDEDVANATRELAATMGIPAATELLKQFAIERARDLPTEQREAYITEAKSRVTVYKSLKTA
jgi:hypothetical protein